MEKMKNFTISLEYVEKNHFFRHIEFTEVLFVEYQKVLDLQNIYFFPTLHCVKSLIFRKHWDDLKRFACDTLVFSLRILFLYRDKKREFPQDICCMFCRLLSATALMYLWSLNQFPWYAVLLLQKFAPPVCFCIAFFLIISPKFLRLLAFFVLLITNIPKGVPSEKSFIRHSIEDM